ncbi:hypothetical protein HN873_063614, partial [Arachis hypogaea]
MTNSLTKWKGLTKPSAYGYNHVSTPDLALEERELGFVSFNANNVYEWNIDGKTEYNIMSMLQHMTMVGTAYQAAHETSEEAIANVIVSAIKLNDQNEPIIGDDGEPIPDAVNTLIFTIASHFIGDPSLWKDRSAELLSNLRCKTLSDFRWYKDTFLTRVYTREDSQQPFWKEKFLAGLPKSLGDKVRNKIRSLTLDGIIPYDEFVKMIKSKGNLLVRKPKIVLIWELFVNNLVFLLVIKENLKDHPIEKLLNLILKRISGETEKVLQTPKMRKVSKRIFKNIHKKPYYLLYMLKRKINNLNLDPQIEDQINNLLIESSDDDSGRESSDDINNIQVDDIESSSDSDVKQISVLSKDQDLLFDAIEAIGDPEQKKKFFLKLKRSLQKEKKPKNLVLSNKYDVKPIFKKLEKQVIRPITIQDLQTEEIKRNQENHQLILSQLMQEEESGDEELDSLLNQTECSKEQENKISNDNEGKEILRIINVFSFMKHRLHIRIVVKDFVFDTIALFDSGADSNCIRKDFPGLTSFVGGQVTFFEFLDSPKLKKNPPPWTDKHSDIIRFLKTKVHNFPCLYLPVPHAFKIVETDASDLGYGGILKQKLHDKECIIAFTSKHWNSTQQKYSTIKNEILVIVLCITKFQSDLLNQKFLVRVDCKSAKDILQNDVKNLASKQVFA